MFQVDKVSESPAANSAMLVSGFSSFNSTPRGKKKNICQTDEGKI